MARKPLPSQAVPILEKVSLGMERLIFFSDAVFAIAITLLVLDIRLPVNIGNLNDQALLRVLGSLWHNYLAYALSFLVIGSFWMSHHRKFRMIAAYDRRLMLLNLLHLMVLAFLPFPTSVISENSGVTASIFYAATVGVLALLSLAMWLYAAGPGRLLLPTITNQQKRQEVIRLLIFIVVFAISIGVAFIEPNLTRLFWVAALIAVFTYRARDLNIRE